MPLLKKMWIEQALRLVQSGVVSNWWGLGCPSHCQGSLLTLGLTFCFGISLGVVLTVWFFRDILLKVPCQGSFPSTASPSAPPPRSVDLRLRSYLHE